MPDFFTSWAKAAGVEVQELALEVNLPRSPRLIRTWATLDDKDFQSYTMIIGSKQVIPAIAVMGRATENWRVCQVDRVGEVYEPRYDVNALDREFRVIDRQEFDLPFVWTSFIDKEPLAVVRLTLLGYPEVDWKRILIAEEISFDPVSAQASLERIWDFGLSIERSIQTRAHTEGFDCPDGGAISAVWEVLEEKVQPLELLCEPFE